MVSCSRTHMAFVRIAKKYGWIWTWICFCFWRRFVRIGKKHIEIHLSFVCHTRINVLCAHTSTAAYTHTNTRNNCSDKYVTKWNSMLTGYTCDVRIYLAKRIHTSREKKWFSVVLSSKQNQKRLHNSNASRLTHTPHSFRVARLFQCAPRDNFYIPIFLLQTRKSNENELREKRNNTSMVLPWNVFFSLLLLLGVCVSDGGIYSSSLSVRRSPSNSWRMTSWCLFLPRQNVFNSFLFREILYSLSVDRRCAKLIPFMGIWSNDRYLSRPRSTHVRTHTRISPLLWLVRERRIRADCRRFENNNKKHTIWNQRKFKSSVVYSLWFLLNARWAGNDWRMRHIRN